MQIQVKKLSLTLVKTKQVAKHRYATILILSGTERLMSQWTFSEIDAELSGGSR